MQTGGKSKGDKENRPKVARAKGEKRAKRASRGLAEAQTVDLLVRQICISQMSCVAQYSHLCFQARMSNESHLAPHPGLLITLIDHFSGTVHSVYIAELNAVMQAVCAEPSQPTFNNVLLSPLLHVIPPCFCSCNLPRSFFPSMLSQKPCWLVVCTFLASWEGDLLYILSCYPHTCCAFFAFLVHILQLPAAAA